MSNKSNVDMYELARTAGNVPREFVNVSFIDNKVSFIKGDVQRIENFPEPVFWQPDGKCFHERTFAHIPEADLILKEVQL